MLHFNPKLKQLIDQLWDDFWSGGISNPLSAIEQISYLLFIKRLDQLDTDRIAKDDFAGEGEYQSKFRGTYKPYVDEARIRSGIYPGTTSKKMNEILAGIEEAKKPRPADELRWNFFKTMPAEKMLEHVRFNVFPFIKGLNGELSPFTKHMANAVFIIEKPSLLVSAVKKIEEIFVVIEKDATEGGHSFQDIQGDVYEMLLDEIAQAGKNGQFRTPRHIIKLMAELVDPQLGQRIADPACGTAGFLLGAYQYIVSQLIKRDNPGKLVRDEDCFERASVGAAITNDVRAILEKNLVGYDIDVTMVRLGLMNLMMHGIDNPGIDYKDTIGKGYDEDGSYQVVMANPPFTGSIDKGNIHEGLKIDTTKSELLFVERIYHMLRAGGKAGIIVPQGVLFGSGKAFVAVRKKLVEDCELTGVITMPSGVFKPYAGVSTAILLFTKGGETKQTFFYNMENDGYDLNDKRGEKKNEDGSRDCGDLQDIIEKYRNRNTLELVDRTAQCFMVPRQDIVDNNYDLSLNKYKEEVYEEVKYESPENILWQLLGDEEQEGLEEQILKGLRELKGMVSENN